VAARELPCVLAILNSVTLDHREDVRTLAWGRRAHLQLEGSLQAPLPRWSAG
jgi:hypothetical protein